MDLFVDKYYELDSKNKINYYNVLYDPTTSLSGSYVQIGTGDIVEQTSTNALLMNGTAHIQKTDKQLCYEIQLTDTIKKIILE